MFQNTSVFYMKKCKIYEKKLKTELNLNIE